MSPVISVWSTIFLMNLSATQCECGHCKLESWHRVEAWTYTILSLGKMRSPCIQETAQWQRIICEYEHMLYEYEVLFCTWGLKEL